jgi:Na+-translocating ferredoxin:NAD+ oxidoreductase RNF subunit RnfB
MLEGVIFMLGLGFVCAVILTAASRIFYVYEDPRIAEVEACFAGANCVDAAMPDVRLQP